MTRNGTFSTRSFSDEGLIYVEVVSACRHHTSFKFTKYEIQKKLCNPTCKAQGSNVREASLYISKATLTYSLRPLGTGSPLRVLLGELLLCPLGLQVQPVHGEHAGGTGGLEGGEDERGEECEKYLLSVCHGEPHCEDVLAQAVIMLVEVGRAAPTEMVAGWSVGSDCSLSLHGKLVTASRSRLVHTVTILRPPTSGFHSHDKETWSVSSSNSITNSSHLHFFPWRKI